MEQKKSPKASLEDKKLTFLLIGLVSVLTVCYVALEWTKHEVTKHEVVSEESLFEDELDIDQTTQDEKPEPPAPEVIQEVEVLNLVDDDVKTESIEITSEDNQQEEVVIQAPVEVVEEEKEEEENTVFVVVENMPEFPGGQQALFKYLNESVKYPVIAQENNIQGRVIVQFTVEKDGSVTDVQVARSVDPSLDKEAKRVISTMPKWKPGKQRGKPVRVKYTVPVNFKLQ